MIRLWCGLKYALVLPLILCRCSFWESVWFFGDQVRMSPSSNGFSLANNIVCLKRINHFCTVLYHTSIFTDKKNFLGIKTLFCQVWFLKIRSFSRILEIEGGLSWHIKSSGRILFTKYDSSRRSTTQEAELVALIRAFKFAVIHREYRLCSLLEDCKYLVQGFHDNAEHIHLSL